jgi:hypothetical protein
MSNPLVVLSKAILWYALDSREVVIMHVLYTTTYPLTAAVDVGKIGIEALKNPLPDFISRDNIYFLFGGKGIMAHVVYEIEKGHEDEGLKEIAKRMTVYYDVEGFEVSSDVLLTAEEAAPLIGLEI